MNKIHLTILFIIIQFSPYFIYAEDNDILSLQDLKEKVDNILEENTSSIRDNIDSIFELSDRFLEINETASAEKYLFIALQKNPWNLEHQLIFAKLLKDKGEYELSKERALIVLKYAETDELINKAKTFLNIPNISSFSKIQTLAGFNYCVVLVPLQKCEKWILSLMQKTISKILSIPVYIQEINVEYPTPSRDMRKQMLNLIRRQIKENGINNPEVQKAMDNLNLNFDDLNNDDNIIKLMTSFLSKSGSDAVKKFIDSLVQAKGKNPQWNADSLKETFSKAILPFKRYKVAYLGVTSEDIYVNDYNYLYGWANKSNGIMSYKRFTAAFNNEAPNQERLLKRAVTQALSSIGHIYGINRCSSPICARAYSRGLSEHDAKKLELCTQCKEAFKKLFKKDILTSPPMINKKTTSYTG